MGVKRSTENGIGEGRVNFLKPLSGKNRALAIPQDQARIVRWTQKNTLGKDKISPRDRRRPNRRGRGEKKTRGRSIKPRFTSTSVLRERRVLG